MAKQIINIGSGQNEGDGGDTRLAFEKINSNFDELYAGGVQTLTLVGTTLAISGGNQVTLDNVFEGGLTADVTGSVFADDSSILVDGVSGTIPTNVVVADRWYKMVAAPYQASHGEKIFTPADWGGANADITGPDNPEIGDWFEVVNFTSNTKFVYPNGLSSPSVSLPMNSSQVHFVFDGTAWQDF